MNNALEHFEWACKKIKIYDLFKDYLIIYTLYFSCKVYKSTLCDTMEADKEKAYVF